MRRILRKIVAGEGDQLGDLSTLADPGVVDERECILFCRSFAQTLICGTSFSQENRRSPVRVAALHCRQTAVVTLVRSHSSHILLYISLFVFNFGITTSRRQRPWKERYIGDMSAKPSVCRAPSVECIYAAAGPEWKQIVWLYKSRKSRKSKVESSLYYGFPLHPLHLSPQSLVGTAWWDKAYAAHDVVHKLVQLLLHISSCSNRHQTANPRPSPNGGK